MQKKNFKTNICYKCGIEFYVDEHHILPKAEFGNEGETIYLCPNCHRHIHVYLQLKVDNKLDDSEIRKHWEYWLKYVKIGIITVLVLACGFGLYTFSFEKILKVFKII